MNRDELWELSPSQLGALAERWERDHDARAPVLRAYLEAAAVVGADIEVHELPRSGVIARDANTHPLVERYRLAVEASRFNLGEQSPLEISWIRGMAGRIRASAVKEPCSLAELVRVLRSPGARFVDRVILQAKLGPNEISDLDMAIECLRDRIVTPRIWTNQETAPAWLEVLGELPRIHCRLAKSDPSHDFFCDILGRGRVPKEMHLDLVDLVTTGSRGLDPESDARAVQANVSRIAEYAELGSRVFLSANDLDVDQATALLDVMPDAFGDGAGVLTRYAKLDGYTTLTTAAPRPNSGHAERLVFVGADELELRDRNGARLWSSSESATITRVDKAYEWIARGLSERLRSSPR